jgi:hypothetical protein
MYERVPQLHLLPDKAPELGNGNWKQVVQLLPERLRWDTGFKSHGVQSSCWTFTPSTDVSTADVPLTFAGAPVVIPVDYQYPLMGLVAPPPDPYPQAIDPGAALEISTIVAIFQTFEPSLGFFLLLNGMLQITVSDDFDYEWASSHRPNLFGGLKVCYIGESSIPTGKPVENHSLGDASLAPSQSGRSTESKLPLLQALRFLKAPQTQSMHGVGASSLKLDRLVDARLKESKNKARYAGKIGVKTCHKGMIYLTMSSHVITSALSATEEGKFYRRWLNSSQSRLDSDWFHKVDIYSNDMKVCSNPPGIMPAAHGSRLAMWPKPSTLDRRSTHVASLMMSA